MQLAITTLQYFFYSHEEIQMKLNTYTTQQFCIRLIALSFLAAASTNALADNKAALKDAIAKDNVIVQPSLEMDNNATANLKMVEIKKAEIKLAEMTVADFKKLDANHDEKISAKEAVQDKTLATNFDQVDVNHDGVVSTDEYAFYKSNTSENSTSANPSSTN
jgi:hypothetical protein